MADVIPFPVLPERQARRPVLATIDGILSHETEAMAWLRRAGPALRRIRADDDGPEAA